MQEEESGGQCVHNACTIHTRPPQLIPIYEYIIYIYIFIVYYIMVQDLWILGVCWETPLKQFLSLSRRPQGRSRRAAPPGRAHHGAAASVGAEVDEANAVAGPPDAPARPTRPFSLGFQGGTWWDRTLGSQMNHGRGHSRPCGKKF